MFNLLQKRLYAYAASPLNEPLADFQTGTGGADLTPRSVQVCNETRYYIRLTLYELISKLYHTVILVLCS